MPPPGELRHRLNAAVKRLGADCVSTVERKRIRNVIDRQLAIEQPAFKVGFC